jgi:GTP-binding protein
MEEKMGKPVVAIVGRPNVGKSTLFNRLSGGHTAIVADEASVTRDRIYRDMEWDRVPFTLIDTGGMFSEDVQFRNEVQSQVERAIEEADLVVFVVDGRVNPTTEDVDIARLLRRSQKNTILAVNKIDNFKETPGYYEYIKMGLGEPLPFSSLHGLNIDQLLDTIVARLPENPAVDEPEAVRIAVVGRPNVGKSSLVNRLLEEERVIVSEIPGTTRDAIDTYLERDGHSYMLVDTSGIRKRSRVDAGVEFYSVVRSLKAIDRADVVLLLLDAGTGVVEQDQKIGGYIEEAGKGLIIIINKWDLVTKDDHTTAHYERQVREQLDFLDYAPLIFTSAQTGQRVDNILGLVDRVSDVCKKRITTGNLNNWLSEVTYLNPPRSVKGKEVKFYYVSQTGVEPPVFVFFVNEPKLVHFSYKRYLENELRKAYEFDGTPIRLAFRPRHKK